MSAATAIYLYIHVVLYHSFWTFEIGGTHPYAKIAVTILVHVKLYLDRLFDSHITTHQSVQVTLDNSQKTLVGMHFVLQQYSL